MDLTVLADARRARIVAMLDDHGPTAVNGLAEALGVSKETFRRDLRLLKSRGRLDKVDGGAVPLGTAFEASLDARTT